MRKSLRKRVGLIIGLFGGLFGGSILLQFSFVPLVSAMTVLPVGLNQMTRDAGKIFYGKCLETSVELDENNIPSTYLRFQVVQGVKGVADGEEVLVKFHGVQHEALKVREGESAIIPLKTMTLVPKAYVPGVGYLLFLYPESSLGFTSPIGGGQGRFEILPDRSVINPLENRFLKDAPYLSDTPRPSEGGPVPLKEMLEEVNALVVHEK